MANYKALQLVGGRYQQVQDGNGLIVGNQIRSSAAADPKPLDIAATDTTTAATAGGDLTLTGGAGSTTGDGGIAALNGGAAGSGVATGGAANLTGGAGGATSGDGGSISITGGAVTSGVGGNVGISGGVGTDDNGGDASLWGGESTTDDGGSAILHGGVGAGTGGPVLIYGGDGTAAGGVTVDVGTGTAANIVLGNLRANAINLGRAGKLVTVVGNTALGSAGTDDIAMNGHVTTQIVTEDGHLEPDGTSTQTLYLGTTANAQSINIGTNNALTGSILIGTGTGVPTIAIGTSQAAWTGGEGGSGGLLSLGSALPSLVRANGQFLVMGSSQIGSTAGGASCDVYGNFQTHGATDFGDTAGDNITFHGVVGGDIVFAQTGSHLLKGEDGTGATVNMTLRSNQPSSGTASGFVMLNSGNATAAASGVVDLRSGTTTTSGNSGIVTVTSGNAAGNSGNLVLDVGTAGGALGAISIGHAAVQTHIYGTTIIDALQLANLELTNSAGVHYMRIAAGNAASSLEVYSADTTAAASGALTLQSGNALGGVSGTTYLKSGTSNVIGGTGDISIITGAASLALAPSGDVGVDVGTPGAGGTAGVISLATSNASQVDIVPSTNAVCTAINFGTGTAMDHIIQGDRIGDTTTWMQNTLWVTDHQYGVAWGPNTFPFEVDGNSNAGNVRTMGYINAINGFGHGGGIAGSLDVGCDNKTQSLNLGTNAVTTGLDLGTGAGMVTMNIGTGMGAGDSINLGGTGCAVNINGNLDVIGTSEFDQNVVIGDGAGGPDTLAFNNAADPNGGYLGSATMPDVRWLRNYDHSFYVAESSAAAGNNLTIAAAKGAATFSGGALLLNGGAGGAGGAANGGGVTVTGGVAGGGTAGVVTLGATNTATVEIGAAAIATNVNGALTVTGTTTLNGNTTIGDAAGDTLSVTCTTQSFVANGGHTVSIAQHASAGGNGLTVSGGQAAAGAFAGGTANLVGGTGGNAAGTGPGGAAVVRGGADTGASAALAGLFHAAGATGGGLPVTRNGGTVVTIGAAFAGTGGAVTISGGNAVAASGAAGGNIQITSGTGDGAGVVGTITLTTGVTGGTNRLVFTHASNTITVQAGTTLNTTSTGNIDLPNNGTARFKIETVAVGATVTAANLDTLTNGSTGVTLHTHAAASATQIVVTVVAGEVFALGQLVSMQNNAGAANGYKSNVATYTTKANVLGIAASATTVAVSGEVAIADGFWDAVPAVANVGQPVYASEITAGNLTLTAPSTSGNVVQKVGVLTVGGSGACKVVVQIGDNTTL